MSSNNLVPIAPQFATTETTTLVLKEKVNITGDNAKIKDTKGNVVFTIKAEVLSFSEGRSMLDQDGNVIARLKKEGLALAPVVYIGKPGNEKMCVLKATGVLNPLSSNANIFFGGSMIGKVEGNFRAKNLAIKIDGMEVARISRKTSASSMFLGQDEYTITTTPKDGKPVDQAFVCLICIAMDEMYHD